MNNNRAESTVRASPAVDSSQREPIFPRRFVRSPCLSRAFVGLLLLTLGLSRQASASSDPFVDLMPAPEAAGIGLAARVERSPYRGDGTRGDLLPLYVYEGTRFYLHADRLGVKFGDDARRFDVFLVHRFEGYPSRNVPPALAGMQHRESGLDVGARIRVSGAWGAAFAEAMHDALDASRGSELSLGYSYEWRDGRLRLRPEAALSWRDSRLNDYYYGVRGAEAGAGRPAYKAGAGWNSELSLNAVFDLTEHWRLLGKLGLTRWSAEVRRSPIVEDRLQTAGMLGLLYEFSGKRQSWAERKPLIVRVLHGGSTSCNFIHTVTLRCTGVHTRDRTNISAVEVGRRFVERLNDWPLDVVGFLGLLRHEERGFQPDFWQVSGYIKAYYYGFPWNARVGTRLGFGTGLAYARRIPQDEARDRINSKLLNYLDPSVDVSVGDLLGVRTLRHTYAGIGVSHRSGIFGSSQLLGEVNGGANYIYGYIEWTM